MSQSEPFLTDAAEPAAPVQSSPDRTGDVERKLAAILAADVVGYSRLMGLDEEGTLKRLKEHRSALFDPKIVEHRGRIVKTTGDGLLVEFASVVDAVRCAVDVQRGMAERNADVDPDRRIDFRIGINLGDIIIDGNDIYGDGVNIAARLESLAEPGGIYVSRTVRDQVRDKLDFGFEDMGPQSVKNIARPVRVHRVQIVGLPATAPPAEAKAASVRRGGRGRLFRAIYRLPLNLARLVFVLLVVMLIAYRWINPPVTPYMLMSLLSTGKIEQRNVALGAISMDLQRALIAADDHHFCLHKGVDWDANPDPSSGVSGSLAHANSITMRLVGALFLWPGSDLVHKAIEVPLAYVVDLVWPKKRILEVYLNIADWGNGLYGADAASEVMFHKSAAQLTRNEAALMIAALQDRQQGAAGSPTNVLSERGAWIARKIDQRQGSDSCLQ